MEWLRRWSGSKFWICLVIAVISGFIVFTFLGPLLYKPGLRYTRGSYSVSKDGAVTSCIIKNYGRRSAEKTRMSVEFLSEILHIRFSPESAGKVVEVAPGQHSAVLNLENIAPKEQVTIFFTVEKPQDKPFDIHLLDISDARPLREKGAPVK
jgi:hypothetical protein